MQVFLSILNGFGRTGHERTLTATDIFSLFFSWINLLFDQLIEKKKKISQQTCGLIEFHFDIMWWGVCNNKAYSTGITSEGFNDLCFFMLKPRTNRRLESKLFIVPESFPEPIRL